MSPFKREVSEDSLINIGARSEYVKKYPAHPVQRRQNYKPANDVPQNDTPIDSVTINKRDFPVHPLTKRQSYKPDNQPTQTDAPLDSVTINKQDFPAHPVAKRSLIKPGPGNIANEGGFDFTSTYKNQFHDQPVEKRQSFKPSNDRSDLGTFKGEPSYRADYPEWKLPEKKQREKIEWNPPNLPFQTHTTNVSDYPAHQVSPRVDHRPDKLPIMSDQPFQATSDYKETFRAHQLPPKVKRERESWVKPTDPFDSTTTAKRDFRGEYNTPTQSMRPDREPYRSDMPFDPNTTAGNSYKAHDLPQKYKHEYEVYKRPDGNMDLNTTNSTQYQPHSVQRQIIQKPGSSDILKGKGPFTKETNYHNTFEGKSTGRTQNMKPKNDYEPPTVAMEMNTVNKSDFYQHQIAPRHSYKPNNQPMQSDVPFNGDTDYKEKFKQYEISARVPRQKEDYVPSSVPLDDRTTAKDSYKGIYQEKRSAINPDRNPVVSDAAFDGTTTMNSDFRKMEIPQRHYRKLDEYTRPEGKMDLTTTHNVNYLQHAVSKQSINKPGSSGILKGSGEMSKTTNYQGDFFQRPIDRVKILKPDNAYEPPAEPLDAVTTNNIAFNQKERSKRQSYKPTSEILKSNDRFDDRTDYNSRFVQHELTPRKLREKKIHEPPSAPLDARTTAQDSYTGAIQNKRGSFKPQQEYIRPENPFEQSTTAGASFKAWPTAPRYVHKGNEYIKPEGNMDLTTMNRETYKEVKAEKQAMTRLRSSNLLAYGGKFDATTSYSGDYVQKPMEGRQRMKPNNEYVPPSIPFEAHTEYRANLQGHVKPKEKSFKPANALSDTLGQRDNNNRYKPRQEDWRDMLNMAPGAAATTTVA